MRGIIRLLLKHGADVDARDCLRRTPLDYVDILMKDGEYESRKDKGAPLREITVAAGGRVGADVP